MFFNGKYKTDTIIIVESTLMTLAGNLISAPVKAVDQSLPNT